MNGLELKFSYLNYMDNNLQEALRLLYKYIDNKLGDSFMFTHDYFWRAFVKHVFVGVIFNHYYLNEDISESAIPSLFSNFESVKENIKSFCINFYDSSAIDFIPYLQTCSDKMINNAIEIINSVTK